MKLSAYSAEILKRKPAPADIQTRAILLNHLVRFMPIDAKLCDVTRRSALDYHQHLADLVDAGKIAGRTANMRIAYAARLFNQAIQDECFTRNNPFARLPKFPEASRDFVLTRWQEPILLRTCPPWLRVMIEDNLYLGLRSGEIRNLCRDDFRPNEGAHGFISIDATQTKGERIKAARGAQEPAGRVRIPLTPNIRKRLLSRPKTLAHPYFYFHANGQPVKKNTLEKAVSRAWARTGLPGRFTFHSTRHTAATRDAEAGFTEAELMAKYRWSDSRMVRRYVHGNDDWAEMAARKRAEAEG